MAQKSSKKLSLIGENIKKIRQVKRISQADFASLFNLARPSVGAYEEGRSEPKIDTIIQIANYFRISIGALLTRKLTVSEIYSFDTLNEKLDKVHQLKSPASGESQGTSLPGIGMVTTGQYIDYLVNYRNRDFIQNLPQLYLPVQSREQYRAFEMNGSEMEYHQQGVHHGDLLVGYQIGKDHLADALGKILAVVHKDGITIRRLEVATGSAVTLAADDLNYPKLDIKVEDIFEIWQVESAYTAYLNKPEPIGEKLLRLERDINALKKGLGE